VKETLTCDCCGKEFKAYPSRIERSEKNYCSRKCKDNTQGDKITVNCDWCDKEMERYETNIYEHNFCCNEHKYKWLSENQKGEDAPAWKKNITKECEYCGEEFEVCPSQTKWRALRYCSTECYGKASREDNYGNNFYSNRKWKKTKTEVLERDNYTCQKCGKTAKELLRDDVDLHVHHIVPRSEGGAEYNKNNLIVLCGLCHADIHSNNGDK